MSRKRLKSFGFAFKGLQTLLKDEPNARIHLISTVVIIVSGVYFGISKNDWLWLCVAISLVWVIEALNTAVENICDLISTEFHPKIKKAKDVAAAAVLVSAILSIVIGLYIFTPYIFP
jgi:diacylglycerol kinase